jgi:hypothetical protein
MAVDDTAGGFTNLAMLDAETIVLIAECDAEPGIATLEETRDA